MVSDRTKVIGTIGLVVLAASTFLGLSFKDARSERRIAEERTRYFYEALPQGSVVKQYDENHDGVLGTSELRALFNDYELRKRDSTDPTSD